MLQQIKLPSMGATMEEGTIVSWKVKEGDAVKTGQVLLELESDKSVFEYESPCDGLVRKILVKEGDTLAVQSTIAVIGDAGDVIPAEWLTATAPAVKPAIVAATTGAAPAQAAAAGAKFDAGGPKISPRARKLAEQLGVDIAKVTGTGPGGRIESADVEKTAKAPQTAASIAGATAFDPVRLQINRKVIKSKQEIPHFYIAAQVDMTHAVALREAQHKTFSFNALLMKAIVAGLQTEPSLNVQYTDAGFVPHKSINVGLAIETPKGVVIAVVDDVDKQDLAALTGKMKALVEAVSAGHFKDLKTHGACMTISNVGMYRVNAFYPIIHPGEAAIVGVGSLAERPVVVGGQVVVRKTMPISLCVDHRIADGAIAARFLKAMANYLESVGGEDRSSI